ncbi:hybrid sensor histidine kinase/response regulator [Actibacterium sp. XHP0104]|uniref:ATP-binding response regulator n=1 Tax=Actibacterium sp. XHP0104 TaxID=2984335 RepID=UPI0021E821F8|nr:ATP-binding protein [Actibacterium sp. XHP0104]MCV2882914.1 response regulator [Actibacterium sp. XHP0104]
MTRPASPFSQTGSSAQDKRAALLGHDIRNAVSDILGGLRLADLSALDEASRLQLARVRSAGEQLARLSDEVLALISGETAATAEPAHALALEEFLEDTSGRWTAHARERDLGFSVETSEDMPSLIGCDRGALERILANLIGNAVKHTAQGEISLSVGMRARETLCLTVRDTGTGFSDDALAMLFEPGGRPKASQTPGTGLGLHIVHDLAEQIGGHVEVGNHSLGGAMVSVLLPRSAWAPGPAQRGQSDAPLPDLSGQRVLVAEDNKTNQLLISQMLDTLGASYRITSDGLEAVRALEQGRYHLALVDIEMPQLSGLDVIRALRAREDRDHGEAALPVLAITAYVLSANREEIYDAGADGILAKPILSLESFGHAISSVLAKRTTRDQQSLPLPPQQTVLNDLHLDRLLALAGDANGPELLERLTQDFETVQTGIQDGLRRPDYALLRARTHVLISLAGAVGADNLQAMAESLNAAAHNKDSALAGVIGPRAIACITRVLARLRQEQEHRFGGETV